ncbi:MAG: VWA domain-containing protein [Gammaproteobacteria bacterium]
MGTSRTTRGELMSLQFEWLWAFALLPLPLLVRFLSPAGNQLTESALRTSFAEDLHGEGESWSPARNLLLLTLALLIWLLLVLAASRPQLLGDPRPLPVAGRDLMMAVDVSGSMRLRDFRVNGRQVTRLTATKVVAGDFIKRRTGDRMGLILFGRQAYLQTPLTFDRRTVVQLLNESFVGMAGSETAIGDAIGLAIKRLRENNVEKKTLILLTDGANTAGAVDPLKAAQLASVEGLTIYTVGIGADPQSFAGIFGGQVRSSSLDETTLESIATMTGGRYFRARDAQELANIYALLDELEPVEHDTAGFRPSRSLFHYPLGLALILAAILLSVRLSLWSNLRNVFSGGSRVND